MEKKKEKYVQSLRPESFHVLENVFRVDVHTAKGVRSIYLTECNEEKNYCVFEYYRMQLAGKNKKDIFFEEILLAASNADSVKELSESTGYCRRTLTRLFKKYLDTTPYNWMKSRKADVVVYFLENTAYSVKDLARMFGYDSSTGFTTFCESATGYSPGQIRKKAKKKVLK